MTHDNYILAFIHADTEAFWQIWLEGDPRQRVEKRTKVVSAK